MSSLGDSYTGRRAGLRALVLFSETHADGGIQRFNRTFLTACAVLGVSCDVLSLADTPRACSGWQAPRLVRISVFSHNKLRFALATIRAMALRRYDVVIVGHINLLTLAAFGRMFRRHTWMGLIAHGVEVWNRIDGARRRRGLQQLDSILSVSHYTKRRMQEQVPALPDSLFEIFPNALSETWRDVAVDRQIVPLVRPLPERFLLCVTRLDRAERYKGVVTVLEALPMTADRTIHFVVAGKGNDIGFLEAAAERFGIADRVHFVGSVSDLQLASLYRQCVAFVLPSGKEGFGIVYLEAMFFGACVIGAREKGVLDVIDHERTGLMVPYGDVVALVQAIDRVVADEAFRQKLAAAGHATVMDDGAFTFRAYVTRLAHILETQPPLAEPLAPASAATADSPVAAKQRCV